MEEERGRGKGEGGKGYLGDSKEVEFGFIVYSLELFERVKSMIREGGKSLL